MANNNRKIVMRQMIDALRISTLTVKELGDRFSLRRTNVLNYLNQIEDAGYTLSRTKNGRIVSYRLEADAAPAYVPCDTDALYDYFILTELRRHSYTQKELADYFAYSENGICLERRTVNKCIKRLISQKEISHKDEESPLIPLSDSLPYVVEIDQKAFNRSLYALQNVPESHPLYRPLCSIYRQQCQIIGSFDDSTFQNYLTYGRTFQSYNCLKDFLQRSGLSQCDFVHHTVKLVQRTANGSVRHVSVNIGLILYSVEKDRIYLFGDNPKFGIREVLPLDSIESAEETTDLNSAYASPAYLKLCDTMFSVSAETPSQVVVAFDNAYFIKNKLLKLQMGRPGSTLNEENGQLIYRDTVSGLSDFANYLRRYGKSCRALAPEQLVSLMSSSVERTLSRYREVTHE